MNGNDARKLFEPALADELTGDVLLAFEAALADDPALCAEFEAYADARANVADMHAWLRKAGGAAARQVPMIPAGVAERISIAADTRKRGKLIRLAVAVVATAAAAAIALVLMLPTDKPQDPAPAPQTGWPLAAQGQVAMFEDAIYAQARLEEVSPAPGVKLLIAQGSLLHPIRPGMALIEGEVTVELQKDARFEVHVGNHRIGASGPAKFVVDVEADAFPDVPPPKDSHMFRPDLLARFGALAFAFTVTAVSGNVDVRADGVSNTVEAGKAESFQAGPPPAPGPGGPDAPKPPTPEDAFKHMDKNSDSKLDGEETDKKMIEDFDDNKDGTISLEEFKAHWKPRRPGPPPKPEDAFKHLDKNGDGKLDGEEADKKFIEDLDTNKDGSVDLDEFKAHKPMPGPGPGPGPGPKNPPPKPEDVFKEKDKNSDGKLDGDEADKKMLEDFDDDKDGSISEEEFKKHFKPMPPRPPRGPGPDGPPPEGGPRPPRGPGGEGEGPRPPRGPGGPGGEGGGPRPPGPK